VIALVGLILALAGGWVWLNFLREPPAPPRPEPTTAPATTSTAAPPSAPDPEAVREKVREELQRELQSAGPAEPINVAPEQPQLIPVKPKDRGREPAAPLSTTSTTTQAPAAASSGQAVTAPTTARDYADAGDDAWRRADYKTAAKAYGSAAGLEPGNATWQGKLGRALYKTGDLNGASAALAKAGSGGWTEASKWRGHIARDQGDKSGALGFYYEYLKSSPPDAAEIQREIDKLNGS